MQPGGRRGGRRLRSQGILMILAKGYLTKFVNN